MDEDPREPIADENEAALFEQAVGGVFDPVMEASPAVLAFRPQVVAEVRRAWAKAVELDPRIHRWQLRMWIRERPEDKSFIGVAYGVGEVVLQIAPEDDERGFARAVAHELRHTAQVRAGEPRHPDVEYRDRPEELDAREFAERVCDALGF